MQNNLFVILLLMIYCHIIDDFILQPICLSKLKCKSWWISTCKKQNINFSKYKNDYIVALIIHSISWSISILLPVIFLCNYNIYLLIICFITNSIIHFYIDNLKANKLSINLVHDQISHLCQIVLTVFILLL